MASSKIPMRKWAIGIYLYLTSLKSVSSMKLHRDLGIGQKAAWFMLHRLREAWNLEDGLLFDGPVEVDESFFGGRRRNMSNEKRAKETGRGPAGKSAVVGLKDRSTNKVRARMLSKMDARTLQGFIVEHTKEGAMIWTMRAHTTASIIINPSSTPVSEFVKGQAHTNGVESFWSMLKRAHKGTFHKISPKHLNRYVQEFAGKHNIRGEDTLEQMKFVALGLTG